MDFLTKKKKQNGGEIPQYYVEGNHEAIITPQQFEMVQQELARRNGSRGRQSSVHLFSGKIKCGQCGHWYGSKTWHSTDKYHKAIWHCNHKFDGDEKCTTPHFTDEEIENLFISAVNQLISQKAVVIDAVTKAVLPALDTSGLEAESATLEEELTVVSDLMQKCIYENAHIALDQIEYQKRYDGLTERYDTAKARYDEIIAVISDKQARQAQIEAFLETLQAQDSLVEKFEVNLWCGLVDFVTVYARDDVCFTFKHGQEIKA